MSMLQKLLDFLDQNQVQYTRHTHPTAYTAKEVAAVEHVPAHRVAKVVVFLSENGYGMAVLPGDSRLDLEALRAMLGVARLRLATESELSELFPDCELGAMPPFGQLCNLPIWMDAGLASEPTIAFNAGTHRDVVHMSLEDYQRLAKPQIASLSRHAAA
jgi:Ala-tRNA(Pro) deacylase